MRIDVVSIFPEYLAALDLSLVGKARESGLLDIRVHDLRDWTHDRHRTVDDTPYGGGAGMVMKPEPWGEALDEIASPGGSAQPRLLVPSPAGRPFTQRVAEELAAEPWLVFACGRYEGIDARVAEYAGERMRVDEISIGDYVLNGGEVAVLVVVEAVARLLPGVIGNPGSLAEESHADGLLEYPVYTKPASWRGHDVPEVLLSGHHAAITAWRHEQSLRRTRERRPDLLDMAGALGADLAGQIGAGLVARAAEPADAAELLTLQRACWVSEAQVNEALDIPPLTETADDIRRSLDEWTTVVVRSGAGGRLVGSVRGRLLSEPERPVPTWEISRLMVAPDLQGRGLGRRLLEAGESLAPAAAVRFELNTGERSDGNLKRYRKAGYRPARDGIAGPPGTVRLVKPRRA
ncbi:MAG TPA: tRNA (guanosine(37)-N1)-methyltransferase TrmD [Kribbellaceae bacterium]|jgi:tRNA (guanine37-N1)-methyltransferase